MKRLAAIQKAIEELPRKEFWSLVKWLDERQEIVWDEEMEEDARPGGPLDKLFDQALAEHEAGLTIPMEEFLRGRAKSSRDPQRSDD